MIRMFRVHMPENLDLVESTLRSGVVAEGPRVRQFEERIAAWVGTERVLAVNSGTSALHLALVLADVSVGDYVISTSMTSPATNVSIGNLGAKIIWADVSPGTGNISPDSVARLLSRYGEKVKAVIAVDWGGFPSDIDAIREELPGNVKLIQDSAHAFGGEYKGGLTGSLDADFTTFSFQAIKHFTTGDGGLLTCKSDRDLERGRKLRWFGIDRTRPGRTWNDDIEEMGYKFQMNDIAASIGLHQLDEVGETLRKRREIAAQYDERLVNVGIQGTDDFECRSAYWLYSIYVQDVTRFMGHMADGGIEAFPVHIRNDHYTGFRKHVAGSDDLTQVDRVSESMCCIPVGEWLSASDVNEIIVRVNTNDGATLG